MYSWTHTLLGVAQTFQSFICRKHIYKGEVYEQGKIQPQNACGILSLSMSFSVLGISELVMFTQTPKSLDLFSLLMGADFLLYPFLLSLSSAWSKLFLDSLWALGLCRTPQAPLPMSCIPGGAPGGGIPGWSHPSIFALWAEFHSRGRKRSRRVGVEYHL